MAEQWPCRSKIARAFAIVDRCQNLQASLVAVGTSAKCVFAWLAGVRAAYGQQQEGCRLCGPGLDSFGAVVQKPNATTNFDPIIPKHPFGRLAANVVVRPIGCAGSTYPHLCAICPWIVLFEIDTVASQTSHCQKNRRKVLHEIDLVDRTSPADALVQKEGPYGLRALRPIATALFVATRLAGNHTLAKPHRCREVRSPTHYRHCCLLAPTHHTGVSSWPPKAKLKRLIAYC